MASVRSLYHALTLRRFSSEDRRGFTLIEVVIVVGIVGLLAALAIPNFQRVVERARVAKAVGDIGAIGQNLTEFYLINDRYPASLAEIGMESYSDPWDNPYGYLVIAGANRGELRKDKFLVPINSDFDLYSMGPDGVTSAALTAKAAHDDIIRANDGGFVGVAAGF